MFGYSAMEWLLIGGVVLLLLVIPAGISWYIWLLARRAEKAEAAKTSAAE